MTEKTLHEAVQEHLEYLKGQGKSERTLYTYNMGAPVIVA